MWVYIPIDQSNKLQEIANAAGYGPEELVRQYVGDFLSWIELLNDAAARPPPNQQEIQLSLFPPWALQ